jgi:hypothetical protein
MVTIATRWQTLEGVIEGEMGAFIAVGRALSTIRDRKLYREQFRSFKAYCMERWGMGNAYANKLISGSQVAVNLSGACETQSKDGDECHHLCSPCEIQPTNEYQVRPLAQLEPAQQCEVWEAAVRNADGKVVTYKQVKDTVKELTAPAAEPNHPSASHSAFAYSGPLRRAPFTPLPLTLGCPFAGHGGAVVPLSAVDLSSRGRGLGADFMVLVPPGGEVGQEHGRRHPGPISFRPLLPVSALFARVLIYSIGINLRKGVQWQDICALLASRKYNLFFRRNLC